MKNSLENLSITHAWELLSTKQITVSELTGYYLDRIEQQNKELNAFITINRQQAEELAQQADKKISQQDQISILEAMPVGVKDVIVTQGIRTTAGSEILQNYNPPYDATIVSKLKQHHAIILGKTNCDEFAMGSSNENSAYGAVRNPVDTQRVPGGSSGGSAAAVAADLCVYSLGTDTGGSIRQPASFCGVVGLKPTYGRVSRYGLIAMASSFDQPGPITKTVADSAIVLEAIAGKDDKDMTSVDKQIPNYTQEMKQPIKNMRLALPKQFLETGLDKEVKQALFASIQKYQKLGVEVEEVDLPLLDMALAIYYVIMPAEVSANLARFDGIRYGQTVDAEELWDVYKRTRGTHFGNEVRRRILMGTYVLSAGYYDAYYKQALKAQHKLKTELSQLFKNYDAIIGPTTPTTAFKIGEKTDDPLEMYLSDIYTVVANIAGIPAISIPMGNDKQDLPMGLQLMGEWFQEAELLRLGWHLENYRT